MSDNALTPARSTGLDLPRSALSDRLSPSVGSLAGALAKARDKCKMADKSSTFKSAKFSYKFAGADEVIAVACDALEGSGLGLIPLTEEMTVVPIGNQAIYALNRSWLLAHASNEFVVITVRGWPITMDGAGMSLAKAFSAALTSSLAYKLRDLLQMVRGDASDDQTTQQNGRTVSAPPTPQQQEEQEAPPANPQSAPQDAPLTEQEYQELVSLARQHKRTQNEVAAICAVMGVHTLQRAPRSRLPWLHTALTMGLASVPQRDRITSLAQELGLDWPAFQRRLSERYGVPSVAHLTAPQAEELEQKLKSAPRPQPAA